MPAPRAWGKGLAWREDGLKKAHEPRCPYCGVHLSENPNWKEHESEGGQVVGSDPKNISDKEIVTRILARCANSRCKKPFWFGVGDNFYIERLTSSERNFRIYSGDGSYAEFMRMHIGVA